MSNEFLLTLHVIIASNMPLVQRKRYHLDTISHTDLHAASEQALYPLPPSPRVQGHRLEWTKDSMRLNGFLLLLFTIFYFSINMYSMVFSKMYPYTGPNSVLKRISSDNYYCYLIPITPAAFTLYILFNWIGLKFYRHN